MQPMTRKDAMTTVIRAAQQFVKISEIVQRHYTLAPHLAALLPEVKRSIQYLQSTKRSTKQ